MDKIELVDLSKAQLLIQKDLSVLANENEHGPAKQLEGISVGLVTLEQSPPHNGECHNDGDEIIIVVSGKIRIESDSNPDKHLELEAGASCIIRKGEWHKITVVKKAQLVYVTPGSNNQYRY